MQPAGDLAAWQTPPFAASVRNGRLYARGASDDKGPVVVALETARRFVASGSLPLNVRFLIEGEEEIGSPSLPAFLALVITAALNANLAPRPHLDLNIWWPLGALLVVMAGMVGWLHWRLRAPRAQ